MEGSDKDEVLFFRSLLGVLLLLPSPMLPSALYRFLLPWYMSVWSRELNSLRMPYSSLYAQRFAQHVAHSRCLALFGRMDD
jgi:hypothetical protein